MSANDERTEPRIDPASLGALRDRVLRAITTASNDDLSEPRTGKRERHVQRIETLHDVADTLEALART
jgi:hypothetical protein